MKELITLTFNSRSAFVWRTRPLTEFYCPATKQWLYRIECPPAGDDDPLPEANLEQIVVMRDDDNAIAVSGPDRMQVFWR